MSLLHSLDALDRLTSAAEASSFSVLGRPRFFKSSSLFSDKESPPRLRLRAVFAGGLLCSIVSSWMNFVTGLP